MSVFSAWLTYAVKAIVPQAMILLVPGAHPTKNISIKFEIQWNFVMLFFITYSADHNEILHVMTITLCYVQNFIVISWAHFKPEHCKFLSNFEFDQNTVSGTGTGGSR